MEYLNFNNPPTLEGEEWRDVPYFEGFYKVSNKGRLWGLLKLKAPYGRLIKPSTDKRGRTTCHLLKHGVMRSFSFPRLIAMVFIPTDKSFDEVEVNHIDENPLNNRADNLEWCSHKYNCNYGTRTQRIKEKQNIPILQFTLNGEFVAEHASMHIAAENIHADAGHICDCCQGKRKWAYGFVWRYKDDSLYEKAKITLQLKVEKGRKSRTDIFTERAYNVIQFDMEGNYIQIFPSTRLAAVAINGYRSSIINCCNGKALSAGGYKWKYEKDYNK